MRLWSRGDGCPIANFLFFIRMSTTSIPFICVSPLSLHHLLICLILLSLLRQYVLHCLPFDGGRWSQSWRSITKDRSSPSVLDLVGNNILHPLLANNAVLTTSDGREICEKRFCCFLHDDNGPCFKRKLKLTARRSCIYLRKYMGV